MPRGRLRVWAPPHIVTKHVLYRAADAVMVTAPRPILSRRPQDPGTPRNLQSHFNASNMRTVVRQCEPTTLVSHPLPPVSGGELGGGLRDPRGTAVKRRSRTMAVWRGPRVVPLLAAWTRDPYLAAPEFGATKPMDNRDNPRPVPWPSGWW